MDEDLSSFLQSDHLPRLIESLIRDLGGRGLSPRLVEQAGAQLRDEEQKWRSLLLDLVVGTHKARQLGKSHEGWLYTARMAEQATHPEIAAHHAARLGSHDQAIEICTGAGHDTLALSRNNRRVLTFELDPAVAAITAANLQRSGVTNVTVEARGWTSDVMLADPPGLVWADPARRDRSGSRSRSLDDHLPSPAQILGWAERMAPQLPVGIKLGPADDVSPLQQHAVCREYIGYGRECRELIVWKGLDVPDVTVTLVDQKVSWTPSPDAGAFTLDTGKVRYLVEPHAAVIAAGEVDALFAELGVQPIDPQIAYGVSDTRPEDSALGQCFTVEQVDQGISEKRIRRRLEELGWGAQTEFKKRGWPGDPESLRALIPNPEAQASGVVIIARTDAGHVTIYAQRTP